MKKSAAKKMALPPAAAAKSVPRVGVVGWSAPQFQSYFGGFVKLLEESLTSSGLAVAVAHVTGLPATLHNSLGAYALPSQEMLADQAELLAVCGKWDAMVLLPWSQESSIGLLKAALRLDVPAIIVPYWKGIAVLEGMASVQVPGHNKLGFFYQRNAFWLLNEILGLTRFGEAQKFFTSTQMPPQPQPPSASGEYQAIDKRTIELITWTGPRVFDFFRQKITARRVINAAALHNAVIVDAALGGTPSVLLGLLNLAQEARVPFNLQAYDEILTRAPLAWNLAHEGFLPCQMLEHMGGLEALLSALGPAIKSNITVSGKSLNEIVKTHSHHRTWPMKPGPALHSPFQIMFGNLARDGAIFSCAQLTQKKWLSGTLKVQVFDGEEQAVLGVQSGRVKKDEALVVRLAGPKSEQGMAFMRDLPHALEQKKLDQDVLIITDGRGAFSAGTPVISHVAPEAAAGGTISILQDGDTISWDHSRKILNARLTETEIKVRLSRWAKPAFEKNGLLKKFSEQVNSAAFGAGIA